MKKLCLILAVAAVTTAMGAHAADEKTARMAGYLAPTPNCLTENAQISINFNGVETDVSTIKAHYDTKIAEIEKVMKAANLDKFELQSMNYSINPQNYGNMSSTYMFNGSISFTILPSGKAMELMAELNKKGYQASVNVSAYRNGGMPCTNTAAPQVKE